MTTVPTDVVLCAEPPEAMLEIADDEDSDGKVVDVEVDVAEFIEVLLAAVVTPGSAVGVEVDVACSEEVLLDQDVGVE